MSLEQLVLTILRSTWPNRERMKFLIGRELQRALTEVAKMDGYYTLSKTIATLFLNTAGIELATIKEFAKHMPGGFVASNPFYNTLLVYILTFCAQGNIDNVVYSIARYYTAITVSYAKKKYFPILNSDVLEYTLLHAHGSVIAKQGFNTMVIKMADETLDKYIGVFKTKVDLYSYYRFIVDIHNKVNQSMKHIAFRYYANTGKSLNDDTKVMLEASLAALDKVLTTAQAISYTSSISGSTESEIEDICFKLKDEGDSTAALQTIITRFIQQYHDRNGINKVGVAIACGRGLVMNGMTELATEVLNNIHIEPSRDKIKTIFCIALLCIMFAEV